MTSPAGGVDFDRNRIGQGELIAGIAGLVLLIDLWFKWYGVKVSAGGGVLRGFEFGVSGTAWQVFSLIDIILFLVALIAIGVAVLRGLNRMPEMPYSPTLLVTAAGGLAVLLILYRLIDTPVDTGGVPNVDVTRKFGLFLGLVAAAGVLYGGWRAMQDSGASFSSLTSGGGAAAGTGAAAAPTAPTTPMPTGPAGDQPSKEGPGAPPPGTSTGAPGGGAAPPPASPGPDPGESGSSTPAGLPSDEPGGTTPPGLAGDRTPDEPGGGSAA